LLTIAGQFEAMEISRSRPWLQHFTGFRILGLLLVVGLGAGQWQTHAVEQERDLLQRKLQREMHAHLQTRLLARDAEVQLATYILDNNVRREFVDERLDAQAQKADELKREAEAVRLQKLAEADCITPRSIILAAGL
jgi:hypothetical protein